MRANRATNLPPRCSRVCFSPIPSEVLKGDRQGEEGTMHHRDLLDENLRSERYATEEKPGPARPTPCPKEERQ